MTRSQSISFLTNPWSPAFLIVLVAASEIAMIVVTTKRMPVSLLTAAIPFVAALLGVIAWTRFEAARAVREQSTDDGKHRGSAANAFALLAASFAVAVLGLSRQVGSMWEWLLLVTAYAVILVYHFGLYKRRYALLIVAALLFGLLFIDTAILLGHAAYGGFPAAMAALLCFIVHATREIERRTQVPAGSDADPHVHIIHHKALAWISVAFFLFGVVSFWPWLGKVYNLAYFWVMGVGVLVPVLYLWGRLRQPRRQNSYLALLRFNRLIPYFGLVLLVAIALG